MIDFKVEFTSPDPDSPQPESPIQLDPSYVFHQIQYNNGTINLKDIKGELRQYKIVTDGVRPILDNDGDQTGYELFVMWIRI